MVESQRDHIQPRIFPKIPKLSPNSELINSTSDFHQKSSLALRQIGKGNEGSLKKTPKIPEISQIYRFATLLVESRNLRIPQNSLNTQSSSAVQSQQIFNNQNKPNNHPKLKLMWFKIEILKSIVQNICVWVSFPNSVDYERLPLFFVVVGRMKHKCLLITLGRGPIRHQCPLNIKYKCLFITRADKASFATLHKTALNIHGCKTQRKCEN